jgi:hypothetical protein
MNNKSLSEAYNQVQNKVDAFKEFANKEKDIMELSRKINQVFGLILDIEKVLIGQEEEINQRIEDVLEQLQNKPGKTPEEFNLYYSMKTIKEFPENLFDWGRQLMKFIKDTD